MKALVTTFVSLLIFSTAFGASPKNDSSYLLLHKDGNMFAAEQCTVVEAQGRLECRKVAELNATQIKMMHDEMIATLRKQNVKIAAIVVGGVVVGAAAIAVGGVAAVAVLGSYGIINVAGGLGGIGVLANLSGTFLVGGGAGAIGGGFAGKGLGNVVFGDHQSDKLISNQFESLVKNGTPIVIQKSNPSDAEVENMMSQFKSN